MSAAHTAELPDTIAAGTARRYRLPKGSSARIVNLHGSQVVDTWALAAGPSAEYMSMQHTRALLGRLTPRAGDALFSNRRRALLAFTQDTSPGIHDTLIPACDQERYRQLGHRGFHRNCADNFAEATADLDLGTPMPAPLNLFMNIPLAPDGSLRFDPSPCHPGDHVTLTAQHDLHLVLSACPQDLVPINGARQQPADVQVLISHPPPYRPLC